MPRRLLKKLLPDRHKLSQRWFMRPFPAALKDPAYWTVHRRGVVRGFALGLFICFIPLPVHLLIAPIAAMAVRANVPVTLITLLLTNPLTYLPTFFTAYWVGVWLTGDKLMPFHFEPTWTWLEAHLAQIWQPFLLGCFVTGTVAALIGYMLLSLLWRWRVTREYRKRVGRFKNRKARERQETPTS